MRVMKENGRPITATQRSETDAKKSGRPFTDQTTLWTPLILLPIQNRFAIRVVSEMSDRCATPPRCQLGNYTLGTRPAFETRPT